METATNQTTGERLVLDNGKWAPIKATASNPKTGEKAYLVGDAWKIEPADIDYQTGAPFSSKFAVERADNPEEARLALEKIHGKGSAESPNVGQDKKGNWWVMQDGKKVAVFGGGGGAATSLSKLGTGMVATAAPTLGAVAGAGAGLALGGPPGTIVGAGGGYMLGKGTDEFAKFMQGIYAKNPSEEAKTLAVGGLENAAFQGLPGAARSIGGFKNWLRENLFGVEPGGALMAKKMLASGARPPVASIAPGARVFQYDQMLRNLVSGNPMQERNIAYIEEQMKNVLKSSGMTDQEVLGFMKEISSKPAVISGQTEVGNLAVTGVQSYVVGLAKEADSALSVAKQQVDKEGAIFKKLASTSGPLATDVAEAISQSRSDFGRAMQAAYGHLDKMTGSAPIIGTGLLKKHVAEQLQYIDPSAVPAIFNRIMKLPNQIPLMQAHALRSELRTASMSNNLTPDVANFRFGDLANAMDVEFKRAPTSIESGFNLATTIGPESSTTVKSVIDTMRKVDTMYGSGIAQYNDAVVNKLVTSMKAGIEPDATITAELIAKTGYTERMKTVVSMLKPETRRAVAAADMKNMLADASKRTAELGYETKGRALMDIVRERKEAINGLYGSIYGKQFVSRLETYSKDLAAVGGKVDIADLERVTKELGPGVVPDYLATRLDKLLKIDATVKDNFLSALYSKDPAVVDRAYDLMVKPGEEARLESAIKFFGENSPTVKAIRSYALKDAMSSAIVEMPSSATTIAGTALDSYLGKFSKRQQQLLFPNGLSDDMKILARESRFLFPWMTKSGEQDFGASLQAASIKAHVPFSLHADYRYVRAKFFGWIADRPPLIRAFAGVYKMPDGPAKRAAKQALFRTAQSIMNTHEEAPEKLQGER